MSRPRSTKADKKQSQSPVDYRDPDLTQEKEPKNRSPRCYYCTGLCIVQHEHNVISCRCKRHDMYVSAEDADWRKRNPHPDLKGRQSPLGNFAGTGKQGIFIDHED